MTASDLSLHRRLLVPELPLVVAPLLQVSLQVGDGGLQPRLVVGELVRGQVRRFAQRVRLLVEVLGELAVHADQPPALGAEQFQLSLRVDDTASLVSDFFHVNTVDGSVVLAQCC